MPYGNGEYGIPPGGVEPIGDIDLTEPPPPSTAPPVYTSPPPTTTPPTTTTPTDGTTTTPGTTPPEENGGLLGQGQALEDLYPTAPETAVATAPGAAQIGEAGVTEAVAADVGVPGVAVADEGSVSGAGSVGYDPAQLEVTPEMTVAGQLHDITSGDSPLMALARQQGLLSAGRRGLMNSSIAAQAAQAAVVNAALPIAQQDATTHLRAAEANQQSLNRALEFGASAENVAELQNSIEKNKMDALNAQLGTDVSKFNAEQLNEAETLAAQMKTAVSQQNADAYNKAQQQFADLQAKADMMALEQTFAASQQSTAATNKINQQVVQAITDLNKQYLAGTQAIDIAQINGQFSNLISQNEAAAKIYDAYFDGVSAIMSNKDIAPQKAAQYIQAQLKQLQGALTYIREMNQANLGSFTPTGGFTAPAPTAAAAPTA